MAKARSGMTVSDSNSHIQKSISENKKWPLVWEDCLDDPYHSLFAMRETQSLKILPSDNLENGKELCID